MTSEWLIENGFSSLLEPAKDIVEPALIASHEAALKLFVSLDSVEYPPTGHAETAHVLVDEVLTLATDFYSKMAEARQAWNTLYGTALMQEDLYRKMARVK